MQLPLVYEVLLRNDDNVQESANESMRIEDRITDRGPLGLSSEISRPDDTFRIVSRFAVLPTRTTLPRYTPPRHSLSSFNVFDRPRRLSIHGLPDA